MKIALLGYGKMGKTIERIALERGHEIVLRVDAPGEYVPLRVLLLILARRFPQVYQP